MGRRGRQRGNDGGPSAPTSSYSDAEGNTLELRGSLSAKTRRAYARAAAGQGLPPSATREDAWQRAFELLFEHLAVSWSIAGAPALRSQRELLGRLRFASAAERAWVRDRLREHCAEHFPDIAAP
jgi:hypothetical protein